MKKLFIAAICAAIALGGCISDCGQFGVDTKPTV